LGYPPFSVRSGFLLGCSRHAESVGEYGVAFAAWDAVPWSVEVKRDSLRCLMSQPPLGFAELYSRALDAYVEHPTAQLLERASELGRLALASEIGLAQLASLHADLVGQKEASLPAASPALGRAAPFFTETMAAFDRELGELRREIACMRQSSQKLDLLVTQGAERYRAMFDDNPMPMWIYDRETLAFVVVNEAAIRHYGYSRQEFLAMTLVDIRPAEDVSGLLDNVAQAPHFDEGKIWRHRKKGGSLI
jgi:PAS domain-containing protein